MMNNPSPLTNKQGFSLLEIIITLVVAALFSTMFIQFMGTSLTKSAEPLVDLLESCSINDIMENMTADYRRLLIEEKEPLVEFIKHIEERSDPEHPEYYGSFTYETAYIDFDDNGNEVADTAGENRLLKVTVTTGGQTVTALFTK